MPLDPTRIREYICEDSGSETVTWAVTDHSEEDDPFLTPELQPSR